jgi:ADP-heptose:LPS heptosyltransferase
MFISSFRIPINAGGWFFSPLARYVTSDSMFNKMVQQMEAQGQKDIVASWSSFNSYERRYAAQDLNGRRLAIYRESGFGDNMIVSGLCRHIKSLYPKAQIDVYGLPHVQEVWLNNPDATQYPCPPLFDAMRNYDYHLFLEGMIENDNEPDQANAYDALYQVAGFFPKDVPTDHKRPHLVMGQIDEKHLAEWDARRPDRYVLWHWNPSGCVRMYPPDKSDLTILGLAELGHTVVIIGNTNNEEGIPMPNIEGTRIINLINQTKSWRELLAMIRRAQLVIAPDSSITHAAAAYPEVPCIGLWGAFDPNDRAKYYENHLAIEASYACPSAPCRAQHGQLPRHKCAQAKLYSGDDEKWCAAMKAIDPLDIINAAIPYL